MFNSNRTILYSEKDVDFTQYMTYISNKLDDIGYSVFFIHRSDYHNSYLNNGIYKTTSYDDVRVYQMINQRKFDYIIIDYISTLNEDCAKEIVKFEGNIISVGYPFIPPDIYSDFDNIDIDEINIDELLKRMSRDKKINSILDEK